jgi:hypothetical protein
MAGFGIRQNRDKVIRDLRETTLSLRLIGKKYGVTRQAMSYFVKREGIERPPRPRGHQVGYCRICQKLLQISKTPHSEFMSVHTIRKKLGAEVGYARYRNHMKVLTKRGLVHQKFGCLVSKRAEKAYAIYFKESLPVSRIGRMAGLTNFASAITNHRKAGWDVPPSLFVYGKEERSRMRKAANERRLRELNLNVAKHSP